MTGTVQVRLIGSDLEGTMREMRRWLDHRKIMPRAFRQSTCPGPLALNVEFGQDIEAADFAARFTGRVLGTPPVYAAQSIVAAPRDR